MISYYELLEMIKKGNIPKKVNYKISGYIENYVEYTAQYDREDFTHYELSNHHREDKNIHFYLNENYLESDMFDESILIIEEKIEKIETYKEIDDEEHYANILKVSKNGECEIDEALSVVVDKINEIIDYINNK